MPEPALDMTDAQLDLFIDDAENKACGADWWNHDFFEEAKVIAEELKAWRRLHAQV